MKIPYGILILLLVGCSSVSQVGYMTESKTNPDTGVFEEIEYSPYYEFEHRSDDKTVLARVVITLGPERVPQGYKHKGPFSQDLQRAYRDGIVDWVSEIYFINTSKEKISLSPTFIQVGHDKKMLSNSYTIEPSKWYITDPLIALHSVYGVKANVEFKYSYQGKDYHVKGIAKRMSTKQISEKYSN
jgi:hypothetical protein